MEIDRDAWLLQIRPDMGYSAIKLGDIESFEKSTLMPVLKLQNDLIIFGFRTFLRKIASNFDSLSAAHQKTFINDRIKSDPALKNSLINYIVALFNTEELEFYTKNRMEVRNKIIELSVRLLERQLEKLAQ